jgi:hypothetical protein
MGGARLHHDCLRTRCVQRPRWLERITAAPALPMPATEELDAELRAYLGAPVRYHRAGRLGRLGDQEASGSIALTAAGRRRLERERADWERLSAAISLVMRTA